MSEKKTKSKIIPTLLTSQYVKKDCKKTGLENRANRNESAE